MQQLCKHAAIVGTLARAGAKTVGAVAKAPVVGSQIKNVAMRQIPLVGALVPQTRLAKNVERAQSVSRVAGAGRDNMTNLRQGNASAGSRPGVLPTTQQPVHNPNMNKVGMLKLEGTRQDMLELYKEASFRQALKDAAPGYGANLVLGLGTIGALAGAKKLYSKIETERTWNRLKREHPELTSSKGDRENFEMLQRFSPDIAGNKTTAKSYLQRAQQTYMAPHEFVKDLSSIQDTRNRSALSTQMSSVVQPSIMKGLDHATLGLRRQESEDRNRQFDMGMKQRDDHFDRSTKQRDSQFNINAARQDSQFNRQMAQKDQHHADSHGLRLRQDARNAYDHAHGPSYNPKPADSRPMKKKSSLSLQAMLNEIQ